MYLGSILSGINTFMSETSEHVKRIHISHSDADGVGCHVVSKCSFGILNPYSKSPISYIVVDNPSTIHNTIMNCVDTAINQGFDKQHDMLAFLITDISKVNPNIFDEINDRGIPCYFVVLDHHVTIIEDIDPISNVTTADGAISRPSGWYFVQQGLSATYMMNDIVFRIYKAMQQKNMILPEMKSKSIIMSNTMQGFAEMINRYDLGNWGKWNGLSMDQLADEIKLQMIFTSYDSTEDAMNDMLEVLEGGEHELEIKRRWGDICRTQYDELMSSYAKVIIGLQPCITTNTTFRANGITISYPINAKYYAIYTEKDDINYFSLISKEILENDPSMDMLVLVDHLTKTVNLRSAKDEVNVARIAMANGGGGHPRAAGFPIRD